MNVWRHSGHMTRFTHMTLSAAFACTPALMLILASGSACQFDDDFIKQQNAFACTDDSDCSEPGFCCISQVCAVGGCGGPDTPCTMADQDRDGDGFGTGEYRQNCEFPQLDTDDDCAACNPLTGEICDGVDNDNNGLIDEPIPCDGAVADCPRPLVISHIAEWACREGLCTVVPRERTSEACQNVTFECVDQVYDTSQADLHGCYGPDIHDGQDNEADCVIDEPIPCLDIMDCPLDARILPNTKWSCQDAQCVLVSPALPGCMNVEVYCASGSYYKRCVTP
jgi:hypothetical protein